MSKEIMKSKVPTLAELYEDKAATLKQTKLNVILSAEPKPEWVKTHPFVKDLKYLPIERVEYLLTMVFTKWWVEVKSVQLIANSVVVTVRLYVVNPMSGQTDWQDGIGAAPIQVQKGSGATEFSKMNSSAIQIGAPAAESYALKDAAEKFGKIFGKDLNRKDAIAYSDRLHATINVIQKSTYIDQLNAAESKEALRKVWLDLTQSERDDADVRLAYEVMSEKLK